MCSPDEVRCFYCYQDFSKSDAGRRCEKCGDAICPICGACLCTLTPGEQRVALAMMHTYEAVLDPDYDFLIHKKIEDNLAIPDPKTYPKARKVSKEDNEP